MVLNRITQPLYLRLLLSGFQALRLLRGPYLVEMIGERILKGREVRGIQGSVCRLRYEETGGGGGGWEGD